MLGPCCCWLAEGGNSLGDTWHFFAETPERCNGPENCQMWHEHCWGHWTGLPSRLSLHRTALQRRPLVVMRLLFCNKLQCQVETKANEQGTACWWHNIIRNEIRKYNFFLSEFHNIIIFLKTQVQVSQHFTVEIKMKLLTGICPPTKLSTRFNTVQLIKYCTNVLKV